MMSRLSRHIAPWLMLIGFVPMTALAHPHGWVDYRVVLHFDDQARVVALEQVWKMDPFYSLTLTEELARAAGEESMEQRLDMLGEEIAQNLRGEHYLTHVAHAGERVDLGDLRDYSIRQNDDQRLTFRFVVPLAEPLALGGSPLTWQIYDDTYYIEFLYDPDADTPIALHNAPTDCASRVIAADPDPQRVADAAALDRDAAAPSGLGRFFAETGEVTCPAL
ncbi:DUF1007 family protein [Halomonas sp. McH1-25]|uniref:DUF1007 family protein n=1 Tax=unclassified Halomonas TaxID=2609666 RepID=UPI001EF55902|nr:MULTISPECIES: DUF1007 family protein [unclassified Halomonas]MCG7599793.1 DUF1007 family protein [Halomonas sp. McH1-25]MCP1341688.1 DUF1007 family protein [Halomonas sp. FL8]MCP1359846.1 DUF1007 family protein [Halomonas sp. BBD45]MCP1365285.1 DUF1007 family protein [Halomonas sp. BBD48]